MFNTPPQPTWCTAVLVGHWVPNHNGQLAVDVGGDTGSCSDGVYRCVPFLFGILTDLFVVVDSSLAHCLPSPLVGVPPCTPVCSTAHVVTSRAFFNVTVWSANV
jgi:hypothetical protein